jgi:AcrR family transcriptional regulator
MPPTKPDRRLERGKRTKQKLLLAAMELIGERGLEGFSAHALARKAGISQSLIYHHFTRLDGIFPDVAAMMWDFVEQSLGGPRPATLQAYLRRLGRLTLNPSFLSQPFARAGVEFYRRSLGDPALKRQMLRMRDLGLKRLAADMAQYAAPPGQKARALEAAHLLLPLSDGLQMHLALFNDRAAALAAWSLASAQVERHLLPQDPPPHPTRNRP